VFSSHQTCPPKPCPIAPISRSFHQSQKENAGPPSGIMFETCGTATCSDFIRTLSEVNEYIPKCGLTCSIVPVEHHLQPSPPSAEMSLFLDYGSYPFESVAEPMDSSTTASNNVLYLVGVRLWVLDRLRSKLDCAVSCKRWHMIRHLAF
jgi:hypothetical protein